LWAGLTLWVARSALPSSSIDAVLVSVWLVLSLLIPLIAKSLVDYAAPVVEGADIALTQREAVNDAWDLPKSATMDRFFEAHPEWSQTPPVDEPFHWKWYFAFQHVGDMTAEAISTNYRRAIARRDQLTGIAAFFSPAVAVQRAMQRAARTDVTAALEYDQKIRRYHTALRRFYYPLVFNERTFDAGDLARAPSFDTG
jgi:ABC-2 type transport system permease protein